MENLNLSTKPVLMIHEVFEEIFTLPLENYILTFDDGLYSQFYFYDKFKQLDTQKIFFVSSGVVQNNSPQSTKFPSCQEAHEKAFNGNFEDYMNIEQIKYLSRDPQVIIGGHSHHHKRICNNIKRITDIMMHVKRDTELMLEWFIENLNISPTHFCFPYNEDCNGLYKALLTQYGFTHFYSSERIPVERLLNN